jgi:hypothetical protein
MRGNLLRKSSAQTLVLGLWVAVSIVIPRNLKTRSVIFGAGMT